MATKIIDQTTHAHQHCGVSVDKSCWWHDKYTGTAETLIAAGIITADQLPGQPGMPKVSATFYNGVLCQERRKRVPRDLGYMNICRPVTGKKVTVLIGISAEEEAQRRATRHAKQERTFIEEVTKQAAQQVKRQAECRLFGKRLAYWVAEHGIADKTGARAQVFGLELCAEAAEELGELANRIWQIFDTAELTEVTASSVAQAKASADSVFQSFLREQCITTDGCRHA